MLGMPTTEELEFGQHYVRLLRRVLLRIESISRALIKGQGLTVPQFLVLVLVAQDRHQSQADLVRTLESDANTVSAILRRLEARKLIIRTPHPTDRRANMLALSDAGLALTREALVEVDKLSLAVGRTVPKRQARIIGAWLDTVTTLEVAG